MQATHATNPTPHYCCEQREHDECTVHVEYANKHYLILYVETLLSQESPNDKTKLTILIDIRKMPGIFKNDQFGLRNQLFHDDCRGYWRFFIILLSPYEQSR